MRDARFDLPIAIVVALFALAYAIGVVAVRRRGGAWPTVRTASFMVLGLGGIVACTMSPLAGIQHRHLWAVAVQLTLLIALVPVGIALGDPVGLLRSALSEGARARVDRILSGPIVRALTFPVVAAVLGVVVQIWIFFGPVLRWALESRLAMDATYLGVLLVGCLLALPLLGAAMLPEWCTEPLRLLFAFFDGLIDALPGILVMTSGSLLADGYYRDLGDQHVAGALMLALSEVVALPLLLLLFFKWAAREQDGGRRTMARTRGSRFISADDLPSVPEPELQRPWWESDDPRSNRDEFKRR